MPFVAVPGARGVWFWFLTPRQGWSDGDCRRPSNASVQSGIGLNSGHFPRENPCGKASAWGFSSMSVMSWSNLKDLNLKACALYADSEICLRNEWRTILNCCCAGAFYAPPSWHKLVPDGVEMEAHFASKH